MFHVLGEQTPWPTMIVRGTSVEVVGHPYGTIQRERHDNDNEKR